MEVRQIPSGVARTLYGAAIITAWSLPSSPRKTDTELHPVQKTFTLLRVHSYFQSPWSFLKQKTQRFLVNAHCFYNFEVRHPRCVGSITKETTILSFVLVHRTNNYMFRPCMWAIFRL